MREEPRSLNGRLVQEIAHTLSAPQRSTRRSEAFAYMPVEAEAIPQAQAGAGTLPVDACWRYGDAWQLLPAPPEAPRPPARSEYLQNGYWIPGFEAQPDAFADIGELRKVAVVPNDEYHSQLGGPASSGIFAIEAQPPICKQKWPG